MRCGKCGSTNVQIDIEQKSKFSIGKGILGHLFFGAGGAVAGVNGKQSSKKTYHCLGCGAIGDFNYVAMDPHTESDIEWALSHPNENENIKKLNAYKRLYRNIEWNIVTSQIPQEPTATNTQQEFEIENGVLKKYNGKKASVVIPSGVTEIGKNAFKGCTCLTDIIIPETVISLGNYAFYKCSNLKNIAISNSVVSIGDFAFYGCEAFTNLFIPTSVEKIGIRAFNECSSIEAIAVDENNPVYKSVNNCILYKSGKTLIVGCNNSVIPDGVESINEYAFSNCLKLTAITIPESVTRIKSTSFFCCDSIETIKVAENNKKYKSINNCLVDTEFLSDITLILGCKNSIIPDEVKTIDTYAFNNCKALTSIIIPKSVSVIMDEAFARCDSLTIYCEAEKQPGLWYDNWNIYNCPVVWGYKGENH